ncbi:MAG: sigma 54-interacting transcriptional regulator [Halioglobus sp.]
MSDNYSEATLPTLRDAVAESAAAPCLQCTIVFHPCVERIGQCAVFDVKKMEHSLGRQTPCFSPETDDYSAPLEDPYLSRRALTINVEESGVRLSRLPGASRCRVAAVELHDELFLDNARLEAGVPLALSHTVVLMLRRSGATRQSSPDTLQCSILGSSPAMGRLREEVRRAASSDFDVLITGATGVGKELVARAIHLNSRRSAGPLISVNMAAVPASLAGSVLFGSSKGAFTGADRARPGYFQQAQGGILFLDEVGDTQEEVQPLLLRALQQREIQVVGGSVRNVDVRVISATDAQLEGASCGFKSALQHRLAEIEIRLPALAEHPEDIGELLFHFLSQACARERRSQLLPSAHSNAQALARWASLFHAFACYHWPGNIRQLENFAAQVVVASDDLPVIPQPVMAKVYASRTVDEPGGDWAVQLAVKSLKPRDISEADFEDAMKRNLFEVTAVADEFGVSRQSIYRRIDKSSTFRRATDIPETEINQMLVHCGGDLAKAALKLQISESGLRQRMRAVRTGV